MRTQKNPDGPAAGTRHNLIALARPQTPAHSTLTVQPPRGFLPRQQNLIQTCSTSDVSAAPKPADEAQRMQALQELEILDTANEESWDAIAQLAAIVCDTPIALVTLVDSQRQWFKANVGLGVAETERDAAFCAHTILSDETLIVEDALADGRFRDNPLVLGEPNIRFYAGAPMRAPGGERLGSVCAIDRRPRRLEPHQANALALLTHLAEQLLRIRRLAVALRTQLSEQTSPQDVINQASHALNTPLTPIILQLALLRQEIQGPPARRLDIVENNVQRLQQVIADALAGIRLPSGSA